MLTLPLGVSVARARSFALQNEGWLRRQMAAAPARIPVAHGARLPFRGREVTVLPSPDGRDRIGAEALLVGGGQGHAAAP